MHRGVNTEWRVKLAASNHLLSIAIHTLTTNSKARAIRVNVYGKQRSSCKYSMNEVIDQSYKINYVSTNKWSRYSLPRITAFEKPRLPKQSLRAEMKKSTQLFFTDERTGRQSSCSNWNVQKLVWCTSTSELLFWGHILRDSKTAVRIQEHLQ